MRRRPEEPPRRKRTATSNFGASRRESHDASAFYARFSLPTVSKDQTVVRAPDGVRNEIFLDDARAMHHLPDNCVALVITSPPYFAGKEYEEALGEGHVPSSYVDYLEMLADVFAECARVLEPGGRIAVNVANLGRKPYRSLSSDVIEILQDQLGLLLRGEIIWQKSEGASGSCAWGSFQSPANPVLRDITERIVIASKGRFDRALPRKDRAERELPSEVSIFKDDFMEATLDLWDIPPESAHRVGHPAPFPVELPRRLIDLYTYRGDLVLDPFMGSGTSAVAALRAERDYVGYEVDPAYHGRALERIEEERSTRAAVTEPRPRVSIPATPRAADPNEQFQARAVREGKRAKEIAHEVLRDCGFTIEAKEQRFTGGAEVNFVAVDRHRRPWLFDVSGAFTTPRAGLRRTDTLWKALGKAAVLGSTGRRRRPLVFLTTDLPPKGSAGDHALRAARGRVFHDAVEMLSVAGQERLARYASGDGYDEPIGDLLPPQNGADGL